MLKKWIAYLLFLPLGALAQEMQAEVQVISSNVQNTNKQVFKTMETAMREFINNNSWTQERFEQEEKLKCTFVFNIIEQVTVGSFRACRFSTRGLCTTATTEVRWSIFWTMM